MRILIIDTFYTPYLKSLYADSGLAKQPWARQHQGHFEGASAQVTPTHMAWDY